MFWLHFDTQNFGWVAVTWLLQSRFVEEKHMNIQVLVVTCGEKSMNRV